MNISLFVYVSGPLSTGNQKRNVARAISAADQLLRAGHYPFLPHLNVFCDVQCPHSHQAWMTWDLAWLTKCDALIRLPGLSPGAEREVARATSLDLPIFRSVTSFLDFTFSLSPPS